jgi:5-methylcytosine-specific restriction protein A
MGDRANRPCAHPGCPRTQQENYCEAHRETNNRTEWYRMRGALNPLRKLYETTAYRRFQAMMRAFNPICQKLVNGVQCTRASKILHHVIPPEVDQSKFLAYTNVIMLCEHHHPNTTGEPDPRPETLAKLYVPTYWRLLSF